MKYSMVVLLLLSAVTWGDYLPPNYKGEHADAVNNARTTILAFICAHFTEKQDEVNRLFDLGMKLGKAYIEWAEKNPEIAGKVAHANVPSFWNIRGPTPDFVMGRLYSDVMHSTYERDLAYGTKKSKAQLSKEYGCWALK